MKLELHNGDCMSVLRLLGDASVDAVVTDPSYELGFMGKSWDASGIAYSVDLWREILRVLKPGGHLLSFGGSRTYHRMAVAIEDAGFEIRDSIHWIYGSGFPKSLDVSKAIDKAEGVWRGKSPGKISGNTAMAGGNYERADKGRPATEAAKQWSGWGTALKPAHEPVVVARKPLSGTVAANVQQYGTGALNIDASRVGTEEVTTHSRGQNGAFPKRPSERSAEESGRKTDQRDGLDTETSRTGRWPPNLLLSHTEDCAEGACADDCAVAEMDRQSGTKQGKGSPTVGGPPRSKSAHIAQMSEQPRTNAVMDYGDSGGASRFFPVFRYQAKASRSEREVGCDDLPARSGAEAVGRKEGSAGMNTPAAGAGRTASSVRNHHPTVKPVELMRWLVRLVTPPDGVVLDPFMGSGTTGVAAMREGVGFVGIERESEYFRICEARISAARPSGQQELFSGVA